jgi:hypothetical protein
MNIEKVIIDQANEVAKGLYMYDSGSPIDNITDALTMIVWGNMTDEVDSAEVYDYINSKIKS